MWHQGSLVSRVIERGMVPQQLNLRAISCRLSRYRFLCAFWMSKAYSESSKLHRFTLSFFILDLFLENMKDTEGWSVLTIVRKALQIAGPFPKSLHDGHCFPFDNRLMPFTYRQGTRNSFWDKTAPIADPEASVSKTSGPSSFRDTSSMECATCFFRSFMMPVSSWGSGKQFCFRHCKRGALCLSNLISI